MIFDTVAIVPFDGTRIRMTGEGLRVPIAHRDLLGVLVGVDEIGEELLADALDRVVIEARLLHRKLQQVDGLVAVDGQRLERAVKRILAVVVAHAHGDIFHALLVLLGFDVAGALVHHRGEEVGDALLAGGILAAAAVEGVSQRDQRNAVLLDKPGLDSAWRFDRLNVHGGGRMAG